MVTMKTQQNLGIDTKREQDVQKAYPVKGNYLEQIKNYFWSTK